MHRSYTARSIIIAAAKKKRFPQCAGKTLQSALVLILEGVGKVVKKGNPLSSINYYY